jgi:hypothetical protein
MCLIKRDLRSPIRDAAGQANKHQASHDRRLLQTCSSARCNVIPAKLCAMMGYDRGPVSENVTGRTGCGITKRGRPSE